jgi:hypothetical protein
MTLIGLAYFVGGISAQEAKTIQVSKYAPANVLEEQLRLYVSAIAKDLATEDSYEEDQQTRVSYDASTVAVLALCLGMHDQPTEFKLRSPSIIEAAQELANSSDDYDEAKAAYETLEKVLAADPKSTEKPSWEPAAELGFLMQQVPIVNNALRRGVTSKRFERTIDKTAGHAVTLAAIAQASMLDTAYCSDEASEKEWQTICADMRDACAEVYQALRTRDQTKAEAGNARIVKTCDACHLKFRD